MESDIKAIIFDFGGVLIDWNPRYLYQNYFPEQPQAMERFLAEIDFYKWNAQQDKGRPFAEGIAELSAKFPQHAALIKRYYDCWEDSVSGPIRGSVEILRKLKQNEYPLYGLSNWSAETYPQVRQKYPFFEWFDDVILSGLVKVTKPDPAIFKLLLNKTGYKASECVLIDDSQTNIDTANKLGFITIHFTSSAQLRSELQGLHLL
jgi:2-haloacid dehalogenase